MRAAKIAAPFLLVWAIGFSTAPSQIDKIDAIITEAYDDGTFIGTALIAEQGKVVYEKGFGYANIEWEIPNGPEVKYRIASMTKAFTSMMIMQEVAAGRMSLDGTVNDYLPDYPTKPGGRLTIHQILSHTSGMAHYAALPTFFPEFARQPYKPKEYIELFWELDLLFEPGTDYSYSSFGYFLLGVILEEVTGQTYLGLLRERILQPLGMNNTGMDDHLTIESRRASGYRQTDDGFENTSFRDMSTAYSTGAMFSTVGDIVKWDRALYSDVLIPAQYKNAIFTPNIDNYGYGWVIEQFEVDAATADSVTVIRHSGGTNGFNSYMIRLPDDDKLIVLLANTSRAGLNSMWQKIVPILYED